MTLTLSAQVCPFEMKEGVLHRNTKMYIPNGTRITTGESERHTVGAVNDDFYRVEWKGKTYYIRRSELMAVDVA